MNSRIGTRVFLLVTFVTLCTAQTPPPTREAPLLSIENLRREFYRKPYNNEKVAIQGWVAHERRVTSKTFKGFHLRDRFGDIILVRTTEPLPDITSEILVTGVALKDADTGDLYLSEIQRADVRTKSVASNAPSTKVKEKDKEPLAPAPSSPITATQVGLIALGGGLIGAAIFLFSKRGRSESEPSSSLIDPGWSAMPNAPAAVSNLPASTMKAQEYATVKVYPTTKVLPGKLVVVVNKQDTDVIHLFDQSGRGEIEIGRDSPDINGGIRIKDKTNTVSRRQARMQFAASTSEFKLINLAGDDSNPTIVNGHRMSRDETVVLNNDDLISMGNLELKFRKN